LNKKEQRRYDLVRLGMSMQELRADPDAKDRVNHISRQCLRYSLLEQYHQGKEIGPLGALFLEGEYDH